MARWRNNKSDLLMIILFAYIKRQFIEDIDLYKHKAFKYKNNFKFEKYQVQIYVSKVFLS